MKSGNRVRRAAMGALVAAALMAGAGPAGAGPYRAPVDGPSRLPLGRAKLIEDWGGGALARLKLMLASVHFFPEGGMPRIFRFPVHIVPRTD